MTRSRSSTRGTTESLRKDLEARSSATQFEGKFRVALQEKAQAVADKHAAEKASARARALPQDHAASPSRGTSGTSAHERLAIALDEKKAALAAALSDAKRLAADAQKAREDRVRRGRRARRGGGRNGAARRRGGRVARRRRGGDAGGGRGAAFAPPTRRRGRRTRPRGSRPSTR